MPKSKKPAGGRPAKNFEPRYGEKKTSRFERSESRAGAGQKPGSKSPSHRGYRAPEAGPSAAPKTRWTATQRAGRDEARGIRSQSDRPRTHENRAARSQDDRPARRENSAERPARREYGAERPARREYGNDRPA